MAHAGICFVDDSVTKRASGNFAMKTPRSEGNYSRYPHQNGQEIDEHARQTQTFALPMIER